MTVFGTVSGCTLALSIVALVPFGCTASDTPGSASVEISLPDGSDLGQVDFEITGNGIDPIVGTIPVAALGSTISALIAGIPPGTGYLLSLTGTSDGATECAGSSSFDIEPGQTTLVAVAIQCRAPNDDGDVEVDGELNQCPTIDSFVVFPLSVQVGTPIVLQSVASDLDGDSLTFSWVADTGFFVDSTLAATEFRCATPGPATITLTVDDSKGCTDVRSVDVTCTPTPVCGNGEREAGEACDDGNTEGGDGCSSDCRKVEACGDGEVDQGEVCDDGNNESGDGCSADCSVVEGCGNGVLEGAEECDDGNTTPADGCSAACTIEVCGNGTVDPGEECDDGNSIPDDVCANDCTLFEPNAACNACEELNCRDFNGSDVISECLNAVGVAAAGPGIGTPISTLCLAYVDCARATGCGAGPEEECYCGAGVPIETCLTVGGSGVCQAEAERAAESTDALTVAERFDDPSFAIGNASRLLRCDRQFCSADCF